MKTEPGTRNAECGTGKIRRAGLRGEIKGWTGLVQVGVTHNSDDDRFKLEIELPVHGELFILRQN